MDQFWVQKRPYLITKKHKNQKIDSSLISVHSASFMWIWPLLNFFCGKTFYFFKDLKNNNFGGGHCPPPGLCPWTPHAFGLRTLLDSLVGVWIRFAKPWKSSVHCYPLLNTKSTIFQKLKVAQKNLRNTKIRFRTLCIFWDNIIFDHIWSIKTPANR